jgi:hypothetical protein
MDMNPATDIDFTEAEEEGIVRLGFDMGDGIYQEVFFWVTRAFEGDRSDSMGRDIMDILGWNPAMGVAYCVYHELMVGY